MFFTQMQGTLITALTLAAVVSLLAMLAEGRWQRMLIWTLDWWEGRQRRIPGKQDTRDGESVPR